MYHPTMGRPALGLGLVLTLAVLALSACGGGGSAQDQAKALEELKARPYQRTLKPCALANTTRSSSSLRSPSGSARVG
jgi:hypothetical protein